MAEFKDMLIYYRKKENLSQRELAEKINVSASTIGMYESGKRFPEKEIEEALADFFNISLESLRGNYGKYRETSIRLKKALSDKNMKAQELANKCNINKASISQYVNGLHRPSNSNATLMAKVLEVSAPWLMGFDSDTQLENNPRIKKIMDILPRLSEDQLDLLLQTALLFDSQNP